MSCGVAQNVAHARGASPARRARQRLGRRELIAGFEVSINCRFWVSTEVLRAERQWSQAELAQRVRVSRNSINSVENGKFDPSLPLAFRIADAFGLTIEEVFERDE